MACNLGRSTAQVDGSLVKLEVKSSTEDHPENCAAKSPVSVEPVEHVAADAGSVWIGFDGYYLFLDELTVNDGWVVFKQDVSSDQVVVEFHSFDTKVEFKAQLDGWQVKLEVKSSPK